MKIDKAKGRLTYNGKTYKLESLSHEQFRWELDIQELMSLYFIPSSFSQDILVQSHSTDGFGTFLFHDIELFESDGKIEVVFSCRQPNKYWEGKFGLSTLLVALSEITKDSNQVKFDPRTLSIEEDWKSIELSFQIEEECIFEDKLTEYIIILKELINKAERYLSGAIWREEYETNEKLFCTEIIFPLLRKMKFIDVRFNHGVREYGKDFTFSELTKFGNLRHFAIQAKAGNLRGNVNAQIDEIIGQLSDAFTMPYYEISANETRNISTFIIVISGHFTDNAKDKITNKIPQHFKGSIYFIDRDKLLELIDRFWK